jgi:hypothetical protein
MFMSTPSGILARPRPFAVLEGVGVDDIAVADIAALPIMLARHAVARFTDFSDRRIN